MSFAVGSATSPSMMPCGAMLEAQRALRMTATLIDSWDRTPHGGATLEGGRRHSGDREADPGDDTLIFSARVFGPLCS